jgi:hypothetical protein
LSPPSARIDRERSEQVGDQSSPKPDALVIVHLSSLDSYTWHCGIGPATRLADALADELAAFGGLVVVLDQRWPLTLQSGARLKVLDALRAHRRVTWFPHDEQADDWDASMSRLGALLRKRGVRCLVLGGLEAPPGVDTGCVNEVKRQLDAHGFVCRVDRALCGWYRDELAGGE